MSKQKTPKREKLYARKRWVARRFAIFLIALLAVNHLMQLGFLTRTPRGHPGNPAGGGAPGGAPRRRAGPALDAGSPPDPSGVPDRL